MALLKEEDILLIKKHTANVNYGKVILDFQDGILIKIEHQDAELTRAGLTKRGKRVGGNNNVKKS